MMPDAAYVHHLQRAGQWDLALTALGDRDADLRAELMAERFFWQSTPVDPAAIDAANPTLARVLWACISYFHKLFKIEGGPQVDEAAVLSAQPGGWAAFWHGVVQDNVHGNAELARAEYERALKLAPGDRLLESYAIRHLGFHLLDTDRERGLLMLRRSLLLRAALGTRPQVAAAQLALARALGEDHPEARDLREIAAETATELDLHWLVPTTAEDD